MTKKLSPFVDRDLYGDGMIYEDVEPSDNIYVCKETGPNGVSRSIWFDKQKMLHSIEVHKKFWQECHDKNHAPMREYSYREFINYDKRNLDEE